MSSDTVALALLAAITLGLVAVETGEHRSRELALIAALAAAAAGGRVLFAAIPNVQPVTMVVAVTGVTLGARAGLATGAAAALASNAFLGQGPWTPWQMTGWGMVGVTAAMAAPLLRNRLGLALFGLAWGFLFDWLMDVWAWSSLGRRTRPRSWRSLHRHLVRRRPRRRERLMALAAGPTLIRMLDRYARKLHGTFVPLEQT